MDGLKILMSTVSDIDAGIYDIDYIGPETHSYSPPPNRSGGKLYIHRERTTTHRKFKGFRAGDGGTVRCLSQF